MVKATVALVILARPMEEPGGRLRLEHVGTRGRIERRPGRAAEDARRVLLAAAAGREPLGVVRPPGALVLGRRLQPLVGGLPRDGPALEGGLRVAGRVDH